MNNCCLEALDRVHLARRLGHRERARARDAIAKLLLCIKSQTKFPYVIGIYDVNEMRNGSEAETKNRPKAKCERLTIGEWSVSVVHRQFEHENSKH